MIVKEGAGKIGFLSMQRVEPANDDRQVKLAQLFRLKVSPSELLHSHANQPLVTVAPRFAPSISFAATRLGATTRDV